MQDCISLNDQSFGSRGRGPWIKPPTHFFVRFDLTCVDGPAASEDLLSDVQMILNVFDGTVVGQRLDQLDDNFFDRTHGLNAG